VTGRAVVVGGGVSGLTTAYRLIQRSPSLEVVVLEAGARPGGKLRSVSVGDLTLPAGADSFLARKPWAVDLCRELGLTLDAPVASSAYLWTDRGLVPFLPETAFGIPGDVGDVLRWPGLSRAGRRRALRDLLIAKRKDPADETLGSLLRRRLGDEATDLAIAPLLGGLFAGDVDRLSVQATFPELARWESWQGSLIRGAQAARRQARKGEPGPMFLRPRGGVERLTDVLAERLEDRVRTNLRVDRIEAGHDRWSVRGADGTSIDADAVVVATEAHVARHVLAPVAPDVVEDLGAITAVSTGVVLLVYGEGTRDALPEGSGFVVPAGKAPMTACTWLSAKWPDEDFGTRAVVRCFVGGAGAEDVLEADDGELIEACARHLTAVVSLPDAPSSATVVRWPDAMPQYELGHLDRVVRIRDRLPAGIFLTGQPYDGVGVPDCIRASDETAEAVVAHLTPSRGRTDLDQETVR
jgi:protoporphyrinogen/coproporphyrinogen III oxidase